MHAYIYHHITSQYIALHCMTYMRTDLMILLIRASQKQAQNLNRLPQTLSQGCHYPKP